MSNNNEEQLSEDEKQSCYQIAYDNDENGSENAPEDSAYVSDED